MSEVRVLVKKRAPPTIEVKKVTISNTNSPGAGVTSRNNGVLKEVDSAAWSLATSPRAIEMLETHRTGDEMDGVEATFAETTYSEETVLHEEDPHCHIVTEPDLGSTWSLLTGLVTDFQTALSGVKRLENIIYPLLESKEHHLNAPDPSKIEDLKVIQKQI